MAFKVRGPRLRLDADHGWIHVLVPRRPENPGDTFRVPAAGRVPALVRRAHRTPGRNSDNAGVPNAHRGVHLQRRDGRGLFPIPLEVPDGT